MPGTQDINKMLSSSRAQHQECNYCPHYYYEMYICRQAGL